MGKARRGAAMKLGFLRKSLCIFNLFCLLCPRGEGEMAGEGSWFQRQVEVGKYLWRWSSPTPPAPSAVTNSRAVFSQVFSIPKDGDLTTSLGHPCQCLATLAAFDLYMEFSTFALLAVLPFTTHHWEESGSIFLTFSHQLIIDKVPLSLLHSGLSSVSFLNLLPVCQCSSPFLTSACLSLSGRFRSLCPGGQPTWEHWDVPAKLLGWEAALCCEDTLLAPAQLWVQQEPQGLFCRAASQPAGPQPVLPQGHRFAFPFVAIPGFLLARCSLGEAALPSGGTTTPPCLPSLCPCTGCSVPSSRPLIKDLAIASKEIPWKERIRAGTATSRFSPELKRCVIKRCQKLVNVLNTFMVGSVEFAVLNALHQHPRVWGWNRKISDSDLLRAYFIY